MKRPSCTCGTCRKCRHRVHTREHRARGDNAARDRERNRRWREANAERVAARQREYQADPERAKDRAQRLARSTLNNAIVRGDVVRPSRCDRCGAEAPLDAHHDDYAKPLTVEWLCRSCHRLEDSPYP